MAKPGPKPGSHHSGMMVKNDPRQSPGGRPKKLAEVEAAAREHSTDAIATLARIMLEDLRENEAGVIVPTAQIRCAEILLERAWGKPRQPVEHSGDVTTVRVLAIVAEAVKGLPGASERILPVLAPYLDGESEVQ